MFKSERTIASIAVSLALLSGCNGGSGSSGGETPSGGTQNPNTFAIGGIVYGLTGTGLVLQNNGGDNLAATTTGTYSFSTQLSNGSTYSVTILNQPIGQSCLLSNSYGIIAGANVSNVYVNCGISNTPLPSTAIIQSNIATNYSYELTQLSTDNQGCSAQYGLSGGLYYCMSSAKETVVQSFLTQILTNIQTIKQTNLIDKTAIASILASYQAQDLNYLNVTFTNTTIISSQSPAYIAAINTYYSNAAMQLAGM